MSKYHVLPSKLMRIEKGGEERVDRIISEVCTAWRTTPENLKTRRNARDKFSEPFHAACVLILEFTTVHRKDVAIMFNRKRCTTYHAQKVIGNLESYNSEFREKMYMMRVSLTNKFLSDDTISNHLDSNINSIDNLHSEDYQERLCECEG